MELLNVAQHRRQDVNLFPVERHIDEHQLCQMLVNQHIDILVVKVGPVYSSELIACQD